MKPVLAMLGPRPGAEAVEAAKQAVVVIEQRLAVESAVKDLPVSACSAILFCGNASFVVFLSGGDPKASFLLFAWEKRRDLFLFLEVYGD